MDRFIFLAQITQNYYTMKTYSLLTISLILIGACTSPVKEEQTAGIKPAKGQSAVIDNVSDANLLGIALNSPDHSTLVKASQAAEIEDVLVNAGPITLFAPTNEAFDQLPEGALEDLVKPENKAKLRNILYYHAAPGKYTIDMLKDGMNLFVAQGGKLKIEVKDGVTTVNGAKIIASVNASNGIVHVIDKVLLPPN